MERKSNIAKEECCLPYYFSIFVNNLVQLVRILHIVWPLSGSLLI